LSRVVLPVAVNRQMAATRHLTTKSILSHVRKASLCGCTFLIALLVYRRSTPGNVK